MPRIHAKPRKSFRTSLPFSSCTKDALRESLWAGCSKIGFKNWPLDSWIARALMLTQLIRHVTQTTVQPCRQLGSANEVEQASEWR